MAQYTLNTTPQLVVEVRQSARARRVILRVSPDGTAHLTVPKRVPTADALDFARRKADWIMQQQARCSGIKVDLGVKVPIEGVDRSLCHAKAARLEPDRLCLPHEVQHVGPWVRAFLHDRAYTRIRAQAEAHAHTLGRGYQRLVLRDTRSRWGSCSSRGAVMLSWRLIMAPPAVLNYVVAHEIAHLAEMNHSPAFWQVVERLYGPWRESRDWLRKEGPRLHRFSFDS